MVCRYENRASETGVVPAMCLSLHLSRCLGTVVRNMPCPTNHGACMFMEIIFQICSNQTTNKEDILSPEREVIPAWWIDGERQDMAHLWIFGTKEHTFSLISVQSLHIPFFLGISIINYWTRPTYQNPLCPTSIDMIWTSRAIVTPFGYLWRTAHALSWCWILSSSSD